jgi:hypothetical protein
MRFFIEAFSKPLSKTIFISLLGHITIFSLFSFSFGPRIPAVNYTNIFFWGGILSKYDLMDNSQPRNLTIKKSILNPFSIKDGLIKEPNILKEDKLDINSFKMNNYYFKPQLKSFLNNHKIIFTQKTESPPILKIRKEESTITFHPALPYHFTLYFKDRQMAHIGLKFNIVTKGKTNSIIVKRKTASGNLEVDLLSMHYISHYLFIRKTRFSPDEWHAVKIELSPTTK